MKNYIDDDIRMELIDGILFVEYLVEHGTYEVAEKGIKKKLELLQGESIPVISDMTHVKTSTREARQRMSESDAAIGVKAVGIIINSKVQMVMINFFTAINKRPAPTKVFLKKEDAIKWAKKFVDNK
jgi:hypothetical protein